MYSSTKDVIALVRVILDNNKEMEIKEDVQESRKQDEIVCKDLYQWERSTCMGEVVTITVITDNFISSIHVKGNISVKKNVCYEELNEIQRHKIQN